MTLYDIIDYLGENATVKLFNANDDYNSLGEYVWHSDIPDEYLDCEVLLIESDRNAFCIDLDYEGEGE